MSLVQSPAPAAILDTPSRGTQHAPPDSVALGDGAYPLALRSLTKSWRGNDQPVLDGLQLVLDRASVTWVGGQNGAGKTTMLRIAAGLIEAEHGTAEVWGVTARRDRARYQQLVSFLPAGDRGLYARLSVSRHLEFWARISMIPGRRVAAVVAQAIADFELAPLAGRRVDRMSMGQRQRLRLAMTFLPAAEVVLLDEPLTSLDADGAALLTAAVERLRARDGAVLWCSPTGEQPNIDLDAAWVIEAGRLSPA
jgi:ABC-2 type transport system ATP-binding protein